jgi:hypothetical protein
MGLVFDVHIHSDAMLVCMYQKQVCCLSHLQTQLSCRLFCMSFKRGSNAGTQFVWQSKQALRYATCVSGGHILFLVQGRLTELQQLEGEITMLQSENMVLQVCHIHKCMVRICTYVPSINYKKCKNTV